MCICKIQVSSTFEGFLVLQAAFVLFLKLVYLILVHIDPISILGPELFFLILAHPVYKMWIIQEPNKLELWNKLHFEEKKMESIHNV